MSEMSLKKDVIREISKNKAMRVMVNKLFSQRFFKSIYNANYSERRRWNGKSTCFTMSFDVDFTGDVSALPHLLDVLSSYSFKGKFCMCRCMD